MSAVKIEVVWGKRGEGQRYDEIETRKDNEEQRKSRKEERMDESRCACM